MNGEETLTSLIDGSIIEEFWHGDSLRLTDAFEAALIHEREAQERLADETLEDVLVAVMDDEDLVRTLMGATDDHRDVIATLCALAQFDVDIPLPERSRVVVILDQLNRGIPPSSGAPSSFMPVYGDQLQLLLSTTARGIVFAWRDDCSPCETMRTEFEQIFAKPCEEIHCFAVYGPESAALLQREYDVVGGPTTLFVFDGRVDARLQGAHHRETIENEIEQLKEQR